jgi:N6-adenosine-specific RNA methylase IME4
MSAFADLPPFGFDLIMADPPWAFKTYSDKGHAKAAQSHYECMSISDIKALPVGHLMAPDAVLWLWATNSMLDQAFDVLRAWGVRFVTAGTWVKRTAHGKLAFGTGYRLRCANEPFLLATNGNPATARNVRSVIEGPVREHSRKPDEAFAEAARLVAPISNARKLELFARESREGWATWGNEATKFDQVAS